MRKFLEKKAGLIFVLMFLGLTIFGGYVVSHAAEITKTFAWDEPTDLEAISNWEMHWGVTQGGPYAKLIDVPKDGDYQSPITVDISGTPASNQTRYFVLKACGNMPQPDGSTVYECSGNSNEASFTVWIPANAYEVPINFRIVPES